MYATGLATITKVLTNFPLGANCFNLFANPSEEQEEMQGLSFFLEHPPRAVYSVQCSLCS